MSPAREPAGQGPFHSAVMVISLFPFICAMDDPVVVEVTRYVRRRAPGGLASGHVVGGYLAGITVMWATGLLAG